MTWSNKAKQKARDRNRLRRTIALSKLDEIDLFDECDKRADRLREALSALDSVGVKYELDSSGNLFIGK